MNYNDVYEYLEQLDENYYMGNFIFNGYTIRILISTFNNNFFFSITCNMPNAKIMKDIIYREFNGEKIINKQWSKDTIKHAYSLIRNTYDSFEPFYEAIKHYILNNNLYISDKDQIKNEISNIFLAKDNNIYYKTHSRKNMSKKQEKKCIEILGSSATQYLKKRGYTAVFTNNIFEKKDFKFDF